MDHVHTLLSEACETRPHHTTMACGSYGSQVHGCAQPYTWDYVNCGRGAVLGEMLLVPSSELEHLV